MADQTEAAIDRAEAPSGICARCNAAPSAVLDGQTALCGPCYHNEALRHWTRKASLRRSGNVAGDAIRDLEIAIWKLITPCDCVDDRET